MAYQNAFVQVAEDSTVETAVIPSQRGDKKPIHLIQYELLTQNPYKFDHEELIFELYIIRNNISDSELAQNRDQLWADLFQKGHPCMRASALTKKYGWGAHYNEAGKIALYGVDSNEYKHYINLPAEDCKQLKGFRTKRK